MLLDDGVLKPAFQQLGPCSAGANSVDPNTLRNIVEGGSAGQSDDAMLGCAVAAEPRIADKARDRCGVDDRAAAGF